MNILRLILMFTVLSACAKKSTQDLLLGEWRLTSWKTSWKSTSLDKDLKEKEMLESDETVIFEKDSLHLIEDNSRKTYHYFLTGDSLVVPYGLGGVFLIKQISRKNLYLYNEKHAIFFSEGKIDEEIYSESKIKLRKK
jgi:hypothetical protein